MPVTLHQFDRVFVPLNNQLVIEATLLELDTQLRQATIQPHTVMTLDTASKKWISSPLEEDHPAALALKKQFMPQGKFRGIVHVELGFVFDEINEASHYSANRFASLGASPLGLPGQWIVQDHRQKKAWTLVNDQNVPPAPRSQAGASASTQATARRSTPQVEFVAKTFPDKSLSL